MAAIDIGFSVMANWTTQTILSGSAAIPPRSVSGHPDANGQYADFVWIAPAAGIADITATFVGIDGTTSDVHVLVRGIPVFSDSIAFYGDSTVYAASIAVAIGDSVEFAIGMGTNGTLVS
jgi:hypothetical protein